MKPPVWFLLFALLVVAHAPSFAPASAQSVPPATLFSRASQFVATRYNVARDQLRLAGVTRMIDPVSGTAAFAIKLVHASSGEIYSLVLDAATRTEAAADRRARVNAALRARRRTIDATLESRAASRPGTEKLPVLVWLRSSRAAARMSRPPASRSDLIDTDAAVRAYAEQVDEARASSLAAVVDPIVTRLRSRGQPARRHQYAPALSLELTAAEIRDIGTWPEVDQVAFDDVNYAELEVARIAVGAKSVNGLGRNGTGIRIGMVEVEGGVATSPHLELVRDPAGYACPFPSVHSSGVAGILNSTHPTVRGVAPGALLWAGGSCNGTTSQLLDRSTAAADWGARAINLSWGTGPAQLPIIADRFYDDMAINRHILVVKSAGNQAPPCGSSGRITSPGLGFNILTVGGYDDHNTASPSDDSMDECSSYVNPSSMNGDREKPEVVAPGMNINSVIADGSSGNIGSGTSWSAPMVTGTAALLMQRAPALQFWPESVRAIVIATAVHNIEGDTRLSDKDGAGGVAADRADDVARRVRGSWDGVNFECDINSPTPPPVDVIMPLVAGRRTRAAIAWDTDPDYEFYQWQPGADLDISVLDPQGAVVTSSASFDNSFEVVDFVPSSNGAYTLRIATSRCEASPRYLGWAWWRAG